MRIASATEWVLAIRYKARSINVVPPPAMTNSITLPADNQRTFGLNTDFRMTLGHAVTVAPMTGGLVTLEQTRFGQQQGTRTGSGRSARLWHDKRCRNSNSTWYWPARFFIRRDQLAPAPRRYPPHPPQSNCSQVRPRLHWRLEIPCLRCRKPGPNRTRARADHWSANSQSRPTEQNRS